MSNTLWLPLITPFKDGAVDFASYDRLIAHYRAIGVTTPNHLRSMGIDPLSHKVYVVKLGYLHPQLEDISGRHILLLSDGVSQLDLKRLNWSRVPRPIHPLDSEITWKPEQGLYDA